MHPDQVRAYFYVALYGCLIAAIAGLVYVTVILNLLATGCRP